MRIRKRCMRYAILASTLDGEGKWAEAESLHREGLALWRKRAGNEDQQTLHTLHRLGLTLESEGKWAEAEACIAKGWPCGANGGK